MLNRAEDAKCRLKICGAPVPTVLRGLCSTMVRLGGLTTLFLEDKMNTL